MNYIRPNDNLEGTCDKTRTRNKQFFKYAFLSKRIRKANYNLFLKKSLTPQPLEQATLSQDESTIIPSPQPGCGHNTPPACRTHSSVANR